MKNPRMFLHCSKCGNIVGMVEDKGVTPVCCGEPMQQLQPNTTDAAGEKHVPVGVRNGSEIRITVGEVEHPMLEEHHIAWIAIAGPQFTQRYVLDHTAAPTASFCLRSDDPVTVYAYCNLHGLWAAEL